MANTRPRVVLSHNVRKQLELAGQVYTKHCELGDKSPLLALKESSLIENGRYLADAIKLHDKAEELRRQMLVVYSERDLLLKEINKMIKATRDILLVINRDNPKSLGQWGYEVNDTPRRKKKDEKKETTEPNNPS